MTKKSWPSIFSRPASATPTEERLARAAELQDAQRAEKVRDRRYTTVGQPRPGDQKAKRAASFDPYAPRTEPVSDEIRIGAEHQDRLERAQRHSRIPDPASFQDRPARRADADGLADLRVIFLTIAQLLELAKKPTTATRAAGPMADSLADLEQLFLSILQLLRLGRDGTAAAALTKGASAAQQKVHTFLIRGAPNDLHTDLVARSMGVTRGVRRTRPAVVQRFDQIAATMPDAGTLQSALDAGSADGLPAGFNDLIAALCGAVRAAVLAGDITALAKAGADFGILVQALADLTLTAGTPARKDEQVRKSTNRIVSFQPDGTSRKTDMQPRRRWRNLDTDPFGQE